MINTDKRHINIDLIHADLTYKIRGAIFSVYNSLGFGHKETIYQNALAKELADAKVSYKQEESLKIFYKDTYVGIYRPDFIIDKKIIVELKAVPYIVKEFETQLLYYLKSTKFELGILVNFGSPKLYIKRFISTKIS